MQSLCRILEVAPSGYYDWLKQLTERAYFVAALLFTLASACLPGDDFRFNCP